MRTPPPSPRRLGLAGEEVSRLRTQLLSALQQQDRGASSLTALATERDLLRQQLAASQVRAGMKGWGCQGPRGWWTVFAGPGRTLGPGLCAVETC